MSDVEGGVAAFRRALVPRIPRRIHDFAEAEVRLPVGPRKGMLFDLDYAPFNRFIFDAIMDPRWRALAVVGPTQNGKTLVTTNIPLLWALFEMEQDVIFGLPSMDLAMGMWRDKIEPVILSSPYAHLLPVTGAGSKGGEFSSVRMRNGVTLRFMGARGNASQKSSHTAPVIILTEIDKMDNLSETNREADPVSLIKNRADAFENALILEECTVTVERGRIWQDAMVHGSGGQIYVSCPLCSHWQKLGQEGLVFDNSSEVAAWETARYRCCECDGLWDNNMRLQALDDPRCVHRGQEINSEGEVVGELPPVNTFGLHYNVLHSPLQSLGKTASQQYLADKSDLKEVKRGQIQSKWAIPYKDLDVDRGNLTGYHLRTKSGTCPYNLREVPLWADELLFGVDMQKGYCFFQVEAYNRTTSRSIVVEYGTIDQRADTEAGRHAMLDEADSIAGEGWPIERVESDGETRVMKPTVNFVDIGGFDPQPIYRWAARHRDWRLVKGVGKLQGMRMTGKREIAHAEGMYSVKAQSNGLPIWFVYVDNTKALVHDRYLLDDPRTEEYRYVPRDVEITWINSMTAEERKYDELGEDFKWVPTRRRNDYLDLASYGVALFYHQKIKGERRDGKEQTEQRGRAEQRHEAAYASRGEITPKYQRQRGGWFSSARNRRR